MGIMARFPKPDFDKLVINYNTEPESVHDCPFIHTKNPINVNTCAIRMAEALVIANDLIDTREAIAALRTTWSDGKDLLLGKYAYGANLCPHGIARGARDLATFLRSHWGTPSLSWDAQEDAEAPDDIQGLIGVVAFIKLPSYDGQGHMDLWNGNGPVGHDYWDAESIYFWKLG
jgi:Type VI secretion system (T6SS), amidase effector protein 4